MPHYYKTDYYEKEVAKKRVWSGLHQINIKMKGDDDKRKSTDEDKSNVDTVLHAVDDVDSDNIKIIRDADSRSKERGDSKNYGDNVNPLGNHLDFRW